MHFFLIHTHQDVIILFTLSYYSKLIKLFLSLLSVFEWTGDDLKINQSSRLHYSITSWKCVFSFRVGLGGKHYVALATDTARVIFPPVTMSVAPIAPLTNCDDVHLRGETECGRATREWRGRLCVCVCGDVCVRLWWCVCGGIGTQRMAANQLSFQQAASQSVRQSVEMSSR